MSRVEDAVLSFKRGFSCSQAVLSAVSEPLGLDKERALKISQPLGGGMASLGLTCGAVTGAMLAIGLKYGRTRPEDVAAKEKTYQLVHEFMRRFRARHGSIVCRDLIGVDLSAPDGHARGAERGVFENLCPRFVADAVEILEEIL
jgi:C_GCAxxG_C_C family probable redox protein